MAMLKEGTSLEEARSKIWLFDSKGLVVKDRPEGGVTGHKVEYAKAVAPVKVLAEAIRKVKPTVLIGAAAIGGVFTKEIIQEISSYNDHPVIFALSNPTSKAECTAEQAYTHSGVSYSLV
jgi:malate dehydrogenase (oxaloacetate-decarboxylating)(NADP+)